MTINPEFDSNPLHQFLKWYDQAAASGIKNPEAMTLATATPDGTPSARIVLYKGIAHEGLRFFTNYESRKAVELFKNPKGALVFYWSSLDRQVRIEGRIEPLPSSESDQYWLSRPRGSRLSALASPQSQIISSREVLENKIEELDAQYEGQEILRPENWGGFVLIPNHFEFWFSGDDRLHDRFCYIKKGSDWSLVRLAP
jgi:pyridoxamine 5'-phosphate oxidase